MNTIRLFLKAFLILLLVLILTVLTQTGGVIYLISLLAYPQINARIQKTFLRIIAKIGSFSILYLTITLLIVPGIATQFGRVPLPIIETNHVQPLTVWTALFNRNYVRAPLREATYSVATKMHAKYPGTVTNYLDAGFPFMNKFPLLPHISHHDGKKLDIAFFYIDKASGLPTDQCPSPIGYGASEKPRGIEPDRPGICASRGYWQYSLMSEKMPLKNSLTFDEARTKSMINLFVSQKAIAKILIEPHLKVRFQLASSKIRLHGCHAVRHDDHIHVQVY